MRIEEEIKQEKPFKDEFQKLLVNILFTSSWLNSMNAKQLEPFGITPVQYNVLRILKGKYPDVYCNQQITQRMLDKSSNSTRIVDKLKLKKLIERKENCVDRRHVDIKITEKGLALLKEIENQTDIVKKYLENLTEEQAKTMNDMLDALRIEKS